MRYIRALSGFAEDHTIELNSAELNSVETFVKLQEQPPHCESCEIYNRIIQAVPVQRVFSFCIVDHSER